MLSKDSIKEVLFDDLGFHTISCYILIKILILIRKAAPEGAACFVIYKERNHKTSLIEQNALQAIKIFFKDFRVYLKTGNMRGGEGFFA